MRSVLDGRTIADHFPGIGRYTFNLARAMGKILPPGDELVLLHDPRQPNTRYNLAALAEQSGLRVLPVKARNFTLAEHWQVPGVLRQLKADVYHSPYFLMPYRPSCPSIVTVHDLIPMRYPGDYSPGTRLIFALGIRLAARVARRIIAVSRDGAADLQARLGLAAARLTAIPEAPDPIFQPQPAEAILQVRARYGLAGSYVLYLGSNKPHKNLPRLVRAFSEMAPAAVGQTSLVIAGHWDRRYPQAQAAPDRIRFLGTVAPADLPALYAGATVFAFPSLYEGFGLPPLEAMACGTPVVCSNASSLPEVVGEAALLFDPLDLDDLRAALERMLGDDSLRAELAQRGLTQASRFTWDATARQTLDLYRQTARAQA